MGCENTVIISTGGRGGPNYKVFEYGTVGREKVLKRGEANHLCQQGYVGARVSTQETSCCQTGPSDRYYGNVSCDLVQQSTSGVTPGEREKTIFMMHIRIQEQTCNLSLSQSRPDKLLYHKHWVDITIYYKNSC